MELNLIGEYKQKMWFTIFIYLKISEKMIY